LSYSQEVKERAYAIDPECWKSYSGRPIEFKRRMERRRTEALRRAQAESDAAKPPPGPTLAEQIEALDSRVQELEKRAGCPGRE